MDGVLDSCIYNSRSQWWSCQPGHATSQPSSSQAHNDHQCRPRKDDDKSYKSRSKAHKLIIRRALQITMAEKEKKRWDDDRNWVMGVIVIKMSMLVMMVDSLCSSTTDLDLDHWIMRGLFLSLRMWVQWFWSKDSEGNIFYATQGKLAPQKEREWRFSKDNKRDCTITTNIFV